MRLARCRGKIWKLEDLPVDYYGRSSLTDLDDESSGYSADPNEFYELTGKEYYKQLDAVIYFKKLNHFNKTLPKYRMSLEVWIERLCGTSWDIYTAQEHGERIGRVNAPGNHEFCRRHLCGDGVVIPDAHYFRLESAVRAAREGHYRNKNKDYDTPVWVTVDYIE